MTTPTWSRDNEDDLDEDEIRRLVPSKYSYLLSDDNEETFQKFHHWEVW